MWCGSKKVTAMIQRRLGILFREEPGDLAPKFVGLNLSEEVAPCRWFIFKRRMKELFDLLPTFRIHNAGGSRSRNILTYKPLTQSLAN